MTVDAESIVAIGTVAGSLISWGLAQARSIGRVEGAAKQSAESQGKRIGALEDRVKELETLLRTLPPKAG